LISSGAVMLSMAKCPIMQSLQRVLKNFIILAKNSKGKVKFSVALNQ